MAISDRERRILWVRAGGRCTFCKAYLLHSWYTERAIPQGEAAHNVGASESDRSPRGDGDVPVEDRDLAENLLLLCPSCHNEIDSSGQDTVFTVEVLRRAKHEHERFIEHATSLGLNQRTTVLRVLGRIKGDTVQLGRSEAAMAVIDAGRYPHFEMSFDRQGVEIDLRQLPGETTDLAAYYAAACAQIDEAITTLVRPGIEQGRTEHLSVFPFARLPLVVYLGAKLDDSVPVDIYDRHRPAETWIWPADGTDVHFDYAYAAGATTDAEDAVVVINASGTCGPLPNTLTGHPRWTVGPVDATPAVGTVSTRASLESFEKAFRAVLGDLERREKQVRRIHVIAAAPLSVLLALGRSVGKGIHPTLVVYDRVDGGYVPTLEV